MTVTVTLPDGKALELSDGATGADAAAAIGPGLARAALAVEVEQPGVGRGPAGARPARPLPDGARVSILTDKSGEKALELIRHDAAHVLATAVMELYEGVKISIGPPIADGFYYDFEFPDGTARLRGGLPRDRRAHARARQGRGGIRARGRARHGGARAIREREAGLQGRADRRPRRAARTPPTRCGRCRCTRTGRSPTSAAGRTPRARRRWAPSSCSRSRAPTGAGTRRGRC